MLVSYTKVCVKGPSWTMTSASTSMQIIPLQLHFDYLRLSTSVYLRLAYELFIVVIILHDYLREYKCMIVFFISMSLSGFLQFIAMYTFIVTRARAFSPFLFSSNSLCFKYNFIESIRYSKHMINNNYSLKMERGSASSC